MDDADLTLIILETLGTIPGWHWSETLPAPTGSVALAYGALAAAPDRGVGVRVYGDLDGRHLRRRRVQLRIRGTRPGTAGHRVDSADRLAGLAFDTLTGFDRHRGILTVERSSFTPLGADANGREERTDNYLFTLDNQEAS